MRYCGVKRNLTLLSLVVTSTAFGRLLFFRLGIYASARNSKPSLTQTTCESPRSCELVDSETRAANLLQRANNFHKLDASRIQHLGRPE